MPINEIQQLETVSTQIWIKTLVAKLFVKQGTQPRVVVNHGNRWTLKDGVGHSSPGMRANRSIQ
jgi:hypothetical protein